MSFGPTGASLMILVAGPYRSGTGGDPARIQANVDAMTAVSLELFVRGHLPVMGEWFALPLIEAAEAAGTFDDPDCDDLPPDRRARPRAVRCVPSDRWPLPGRRPHGQRGRGARQGRLPRHRGDPVTAESATFSKSEMMIVAAARALAGQRVCFVGVGLPNIAVNLAKRTIAPDLELVYEAGVFGARPARLPLSIGDPTIVTGATAVVSMVELFGYYLQRGLIDVGFLGAAQIDRFGNINTTVIGDYAKPATRLPGIGWGVRDRDQRPGSVRDHAPEQAQLRRDDRLPDVAGEPRRCRAGRTDPARRRVARSRAYGRRDRPRDLPLRRARGDASRLTASWRDDRGRARDHRLGGGGLRGGGRHVTAERARSCG